MIMNKETIKKNIDYQKDVREIATSLFYCFYIQYYENDFLQYLEIEDDISIISDENKEFKRFKEESIFELMSKAEKFLEYFKDKQKAKETIKFLNVINHKKAKELIEEM